MEKKFFPVHQINFFLQLPLGAAGTCHTYASITQDLQT